MWRGEGWPETWKEGTIVPVVKKGRGEVARDYRVITIVPSMYKIYALRLKVKEGSRGKGNAIEEPDKI